MLESLTTIFWITFLTLHDGLYPVKEEIASSEIDTNPLMAILNEGQSHDHPDLMLE